MYADNTNRSTPSIARIVQFVADYRERFGFSPSTEDMAKGLRLERSWCSRVARAAADRGLLVADPGVARSWRLPAASGTTTTSRSGSRKRRTR
jgi:hypothetical protein